MPRPALLDRLRYESVAEYRRAARARFAEGVVLATMSRHRLAAIYLWGYTVEMLLKAAYFDLLGFPPDHRVRKPDVDAAMELASDVGVRWNRVDRFHNLESWALLLTQTRAANPDWEYADPTYGQQVVDTARRVQGAWGTMLRYHRDWVSRRDTAAVQTAVRWLLASEHQL